MTHRAIYAAPFVYDLAFSYRDIDRERTFLADVYERRRGRGPASFVELAAGPARHALAFAAMGIRSHAVDLSPEMVAYGRELADARNVHLAYERGDMRSFTLEAPVDLA
ncbi:MAG: class I SAM-dependent methyltransferase, partial [Deltaproteobacteria bacterium]|nr:class I SAM-dependent methyltransferase [Deltaproteobacteria bacterium]